MLVSSSPINLSNANQSSACPLNFYQLFTKLMRTVMRSLLIWELNYIKHIIDIDMVAITVIVVRKRERLKKH